MSITCRRAIHAAERHYRGLLQSRDRTATRCCSVLQMDNSRRPGAIVPSLAGVGVGPKAVARVGIVAVIAGAGIVAVIPMVGIVAVVIEGKEGIAITPPKRWWEDASEPEHGAEMPKAMVGPAAIIGIGHLWLDNGGSKQQCC